MRRWAGSTERCSLALGVEFRFALADKTRQMVSEGIRAHVKIIEVVCLYSTIAYHRKLVREIQCTNICATVQEDTIYDAKSFDAYLPV